MTAPTSRTPTYADPNRLEANSQNRSVLLKARNYYQRVGEGKMQKLVDDYLHQLNQKQEKESAGKSDTSRRDTWRREARADRARAKKHPGTHVRCIKTPSSTQETSAGKDKDTTRSWVDVCNQLDIPSKAPAKEEPKDTAAVASVATPTEEKVEAAAVALKPCRGNVDSMLMPFEMPKPALESWLPA